MARTNEIHIAGFAATDGTRNGKGPLRFRLGHGGGKKKDGGYWPSHFFSIICWSKDAPVVVKGEEVEVSGRLSTSTWTKNSGEKRTDVEIVADEIILPGRKKTDPLEIGDAEIAF